MITSPFFYLTTNLKTKSTSRIYLLKQKNEQYKKDYIDGEFNWNARKGEILANWAGNLEELVNYGEEPGLEINSIASYIAKQLRESGIPETSIHYVYDVLPEKYKRDWNRQNNDESRKSDFQNTVVFDEQDNENVELSDNQQKSLASLKKKLLELIKSSPTEFQQGYLNIQREDKERRIRTKSKKELYEQLAYDFKIPLPFYKKTSAEIPPEQMHGVTLLSQQIHGLGEDYIQIGKYLFDIEKSIIQFNPGEEKGNQLGMMIKRHRNKFVKAIRSLYVPYSDKKWSADIPEWIKIQLSKIGHGKNAAGTIHSRDTGEIVIRKDKDGNFYLVKLDRDITREQVGDKSPEMFQLALNIIEQSFAFEGVMALHEWSYKTYLQEGELPSQEEMKSDKQQHLHKME